MTQALNWNLATFLQQHWQKKPLLQRAALPHFCSPIDAHDLAGLACEEIAESRLIQGSDQQSWQLQKGPLPESIFASLAEKDWTLLVQDVDKLLAEVDALWDIFDFIPVWRRDDIMVSYAAPGGSVGAHIDAYDVFLVQASGERLWQWESTPSNSPQQDHNGLKLVQDFNPDMQATLQPGDMLYLPPGYAHHGIATSAQQDCVTFSFGLRAPAVEELLVEYAETQVAEKADSSRFANPDQSPTTPSHQLSHDEVESLRHYMMQQMATDADFPQWCAKFATAYRNPHTVAPPPEPYDRNAIAQARAAGATFYRNPWSRFLTLAGDDALYVAGMRIAMPKSIANLIAGQRAIQACELDDCPVEVNSVLLSLVNAGHLTYELT